MFRMEKGKKLKFFHPVIFHSSLSVVGNDFDLTRHFFNAFNLLDLYLS